MAPPSTPPPRGPRPAARPGRDRPLRPALRMSGDDPAVRREVHIGLEALRVDPPCGLEVSRLEPTLLPRLEVPQGHERRDLHDLRDAVLVPHDVPDLEGAG